ncbi:MAG: PD-(D/E)XK nuclease family protein, partial [Bacteroidota bacterium]|nr:PD-(D/E)XK nuclease family protein [Bacteroidota bacterium]
RLEEALHGGNPAVDTARLRDIAILARGYEELLGNSLVDEPRGWLLVKQELIARGSRALNTLFPTARLLLLEGFSMFRPPELAFLEVLSQQDMPVVVSIDYSPDNGPLFGNFQELVERLREVGYEAYSADQPVFMTELTPPEERISLPLGTYLRRWLFNTEREIRHPGFSSVVTILECRDREEEVFTIARLVKELLCRRGYRPDEIAIVMRQPERYSSLFREVFALYGIPANVTDRFWLVQSPIAVAVVSLLTLSLNGFRRVDLERIVQNPYVRLTGLAGEPIDGMNLLTVAVRRRVLGGHRFGGALGWQRQLQTACQFLQRQLEVLASDPYSDPMECEQLQRELAACQKALQDFEVLRQRLSWDARLYTPLEFLRLLTEDILVGMGIYDAIGAAYEQLRQQPWRSDAEWLYAVEQLERDARALTHLTELAEEFVALFQRCWGKAARPLGEYVERFTIALRGGRYQVREKPGAGVTVTSIEQIRGLPFRVLILCGAVDGEFPLPYRVEHLLGYELPQAEERHRRSERMLFYQFLTNHTDALERGEQRLYIVYPLLQGTEQLVRSPFVEELLKVTSLESDGCVVHVPALVQLFHVGWDAEQEIPPVLQHQYERAPWIAVRGSLTEVLALAQERGVELPELREALVPLPASIQPWEPDPAERPLEISQHDQERFGQRVGYYFSATELELYRRCPYRYFASRVLRLRVPETVPLELSPLERGIVLHRVVYRFFRELQQESKPFAVALRTGLPPLQPASLDEGIESLYRRLTKIAQEELQHVRFEHPWFELEMEEMLGTEEQPGVLWFWLQGEYARQRLRPGFLPVAFEFSFGMRPVLTQPVPLGKDAWLQGRIDRVELKLEGGSMLLGIADYKSGKLLRQASQTDVQQGFHLQLPLYLWAAQYVLKRDYGVKAEPAFAAFYALRPQPGLRASEPEEPERLLVVQGGKQPAVEEILERSRGYAQEAVENIGRALFPVAPYRRTFCRTCPYTALCRVMQIQPVEEEQ